MKTEQRLDMMMSTSDACVAMSDGNPGAAMTCANLLKYGAAVDPQSALGGLGPILLCDSLGIYAERLYMLWNDVCGRDVAKVIAVLRAHQLGRLAGTTSSAIDHAIDNYGAGLDLEAVLAAVKAELPGFDETKGRE